MIDVGGALSTIAFKFELASISYYCCRPALLPLNSLTPQFQAALCHKRSIIKEKIIVHRKFMGCTYALPAQNTSIKRLIDSVAMVRLNLNGSSVP